MGIAGVFKLEFHDAVDVFEIIAIHVNSIPGIALGAGGSQEFIVALEIFAVATAVAGFILVFVQTQAYALAPIIPFIINGIPDGAHAFGPVNAVVAVFAIDQDFHGDVNGVARDHGLEIAVGDAVADLEDGAVVEILVFRAVRIAFIVIFKIEGCTIILTGFAAPVDVAGGGSSVESVRRGEPGEADYHGHRH
jgi:hypothetical protein